MRCSSTAKFRKLSTCPSTEVLVLYKDAGLATERRRRVAAHLAACDFCGAEMQLLSRHWTRAPRAAATTVLTIEMPLNLRRLAEDLIDEPALQRARFIETIYEIDRLTLTDA
jgi:anti-sigma factor RsiW